jgi:hypothetical protein
MSFEYFVNAWVLNSRGLSPGIVMYFGFPPSNLRYLIAATDQPRH